VAAACSEGPRVSGCSLSPTRSETTAKHEGRRLMVPEPSVACCCTFPYGRRTELAARQRCATMSVVVRERRPTAGTREQEDRMIQRLDNVGVAVSDVPRAVAFYGQVLGLQAQGTDTDGTVQVGNVTLYLFRSQAGGQVGRTTDYYHNPVGLDHLAFEVPDIEQASTELEGRGVQFGGPIVGDSGTFRYRGFSDPDGNMLYIIQHPG
jgi:catechol 2,3-dioxygenase-like lactoylglutathione lyase family enzyme